MKTCKHCGGIAKLYICEICGAEICPDCYGEYIICTCSEVRYDHNGDGYPADYEQCCGECAKNNEERECEN